MASCTSRTVASPRRQSTLMTSVSNFVSAMRSLAMRAYYSCSSAVSRRRFGSVLLSRTGVINLLLADFLVGLLPRPVHFNLALVVDLVLADPGEGVARIH